MMKKVLLEIDGKKIVWEGSSTDKNDFFKYELLTSIAYGKTTLESYDYDYVSFNMEMALDFSKRFLEIFDNYMFIMKYDSHTTLIRQTVNLKLSSVVIGQTHTGQGNYFKPEMVSKSSFNEIYFISDTSHVLYPKILDYAASKNKKCITFLMG